MNPQLSHQVVLILSWLKNKNLLPPLTSSFPCCNALTGYQRIFNASERGTTESLSGVTWLQVFRTVLFKL